MIYVLFPAPSINSGWMAGKHPRQTPLLIYSHQRDISSGQSSFCMLQQVGFLGRLVTCHYKCNYLRQESISSHQDYCCSSMPPEFLFSLCCICMGFWGLYEVRVISVWSLHVFWGGSSRKRMIFFNSQKTCSQVTYRYNSLSNTYRP